MTVPVARRRACRPKTRTGCYTCKAKHVKCDEYKPACRRCTTSGLTCGGYSCVSTAPANITVARKPACLRPRLPILTSATGLTPVERGAVDFFFRQTANQLLGAFSPLSGHQHLVDACAGMCFKVPVITHIAAALGAVHLAHGSAFTATSIKDHEDFAEQQGAKATTIFRNYIGTIVGEYTDTHAEVILLVSLLFYYYELWRVRDHAAGVHLRSALRILYERRYDQTRADGTHGNKRLVLIDTEPGDSLSLLLRTFVRLDGDVTISMGEPYLYPAVQESIPTAFFSLDRAMVHLDALSASVGAITGDLHRMAMTGIESMDPAELSRPGMVNCLAGVLSRTLNLESAPQLSTRMQEAEHSLHQWMVAVASVLTEPEQEHVQLLSRIQFFSLWLEMKSWRKFDELYTDSLQENFSYIVDQCEQYDKLYQKKVSQTVPGSTRCSSTHSWPFHSLGTRLIICLCGVAFKCRDSSIRRRCLKLLASIDLQGVFDTQYLVSFVQAVVDFEEARARVSGFVEDTQDLLCHQVSSKARLLNVDLDRSVLAAVPEFYKANKGSFVYAVLGPGNKVEVRTRSFFIDRRASERFVNTHIGWGSTKCKLERTTWQDL